MKNTKYMNKKALILFTLAALLLTTLQVQIAAASEHLNGKVVKLEDSSTLYYISDDGQRFVFPNQKTYHSWFSDFSDVAIVTVEELADYHLTGNIRYRPGVLLVKIQTDPRVYAVGQNGQLRWIASESVARKLYGAFWSELIDDISPAFFVNYLTGDVIDDEDDFNPQDETAENETIDHNRGKSLRAHIRHRKADTRRCNKRGPSRICRVGDSEEDDVDENEVEDLPGDTVRMCHVPRGNPDNAHTIIIGKPAARAHLAHGDSLGACEGEEEPPANDTTPPVISNVTVDPSGDSATITWDTNEPANSKITFADETLATASTTEMVSMTELVTSHSLDLTGLATSTTYYFTVESVDESGNTAIVLEDTFITDTEVVPEPDETPPIISSIVVNASSTSAIISWVTDEDSDSTVEYATESLATATSTEMVTDASLVTSHELELTSLTASTTYFFIVKSADASANSAQSTEDSLTTL